MALRTRREKPLEQLDEKSIRKRMQEAAATMDEIEALDARDVVAAGKADEHLATMERSLEVLEAGKAELAARRREAVLPNMSVARAWRERQDEKDARRKKGQPVVDALRRVVTFSNPELKGEKLDPNRLSDEEGTELKELVRRKLAFGFGDEGAVALSDEETARYEALVGKSAGDEELFPKKRREATAKAKIAEIAKARRRHPQAESLVAAIFGDPDVFDFLHERLRKDVRLFDEYGRESRTTSLGRVLELDHVAVLFAVVSLIVENAGHEVRLNQHGAPVGRKTEDGRLPFLDMKKLGQLRRNGFVTVRSEGSDFLVGLGPRVRRLAKRWEIELAEENT